MSQLLLRLNVGLVEVRTRNAIMTSRRIYLLGVDPAARVSERAYLIMRRINRRVGTGEVDEVDAMGVVLHQLHVDVVGAGKKLEAWYDAARRALGTR